MAKKDRFIKIKENGGRGKKGVKRAEALSIWQKISLSVVVLAALYSLLAVLNIFLADVSFNLGESAARYGFYSEALGHYQDAISLNPREPRYHRERAWVLAASGSATAAVNEAETAYRLNPQNSLTLRSIIATYKLLAKDDSQYQQRAEELIQEAINQQPTNPELYLEQAKILRESGKVAEAGESLKRALELKPDYPEARELLRTLQ